jgi:superfamily II DNA or RNA helicase
MHSYSYKFEDNNFFGKIEDENEMITPEGVFEFMNSITSLKVRDYQYKAVYQALKYNRKLLLSPTASGKSLMIYSIVRYHVEQDNDVLIVVPTTSLVEQMYADFKDYGWNVDEYCHRVYSGKERFTDKQVIITTWQSVYKLPSRYFERFKCVIGDEAHLFKSKSLTGLMSKLHNAKYRIGFTGTLDGTKTHKWVLEGLFGPCDQVTKTDHLIQKGHLANFRIKILVCKHEYQPFTSYQEEIDYLVQHPKRNNLIKNLVKDLSGNTLVLFNYVEKHGRPLFDLINNGEDKNRKVFIYGGVDTEDREDIRLLTEREDNCVIIASYGTFSTGINIKNLHNVVFASPSKSRIRNLQSIGRVLRKSDNKNIATLYDIADDISHNKLRNFTLKHLEERIKIYNEENFNYEIINLQTKF